MIKAVPLFKARLPMVFFIGVALLLLVVADNVNGANRYSVATGNWNSTGT